MAGAAQLAKLSSLWMGDFSAGTPNKAFAFTDFRDGCSEELIDTGERAAWGTLSHPERRVRRNFKRANPLIDLVPNPDEWENLLQWIQGANPTATSAAGTDTIVYPLSNVALERSIVHSDGVRPILLTGVGVDRATIRGVQQQEVTLSLECVGRNWTITGVPSPTAARSTLPSYIFTDLVFSVAGTSTYKCRQFELSVNKAIDRDRFFNTATLPGVIARDRVVTLRAELPWGLHYALWQSGAGDGGVAVQLLLTMSTGGDNYTLQIDLGAVRANTPPTDYRVPDETFLMWDAQAFAPDGGPTSYTLTDELLFTLTKPTP